MNPATAINTKTQSKLVVQTLAEQIGALHREIEDRSAEIHKLLTTAKQNVGEGGWLRWLTDNREVLGFGERQARRYLREPDARVSDGVRHAEGERKRRAATKASKKEATAESSPATEPGDRGEVEPEDETTGVLSTIRPVNGKRVPKASTTKGLTTAMDNILKSMASTAELAGEVAEEVKVWQPRWNAGIEAVTKKILALKPPTATPPSEQPSEITPTETKQNKVKAPANEQPAPKKLKPGSPAWIEEQVEAICRASDNLQSLYPKLNRYQQERITTAQKALGHVVRIGVNSTQVHQVSLELVQLWNQQDGEQVEVEGYLMRWVKEAVANVPYIRPWKQVIEKIYAAVGVTWFTSEHFEWLTETRDQSDLDGLEKEWGTPAAPESVKVSHDGDLADREPEPVEAAP